MKKMLVLLITLMMAAMLTCAVAEDAPTAYTSGDFHYFLLEDGTAEIANYTGKAEQLTSPTTLDGYRVTSIAEYAFSFCESLTSITIPDSITSIREGAFFNCNSLTSITIPDSVTSIGVGAFGCCPLLTSIDIPAGVTSIGDSTFFGCGSLTSITIPDSVTSIGNWAFESCGSLTSITIPDSVTFIGEYAFADCPSLTSVTVGCGSYAHQYCIDNGLPYTCPDTNDWLLN